MISLFDAQMSHCYQIAEIKNIQLANDIGSYGIYKNSIVMKVDSDDLNYATLKLQTKDGTCTVWGHLAKKIFVKAGKQASKNIYDVEEGKTAILESVQGCETFQERLAFLGLVPGRRIKVQKRLPFMQYMVLIDGKIRVKLSEAIASTLFGVCMGKEMQFSFARKDKPFLVTKIISGEKMGLYLSEIGIDEGAEIQLTGIEPGKQVIFDEDASIALNVLEGYRLLISPETAKAIKVI